MQQGETLGNAGLAFLPRGSALLKTAGRDFTALTAAWRDGIPEAGGHTSGDGADDLLQDALHDLLGFLLVAGRLLFVRVVCVSLRQACGVKDVTVKRVS